MDAHRIAPLVTGLALGACGSVADPAPAAPDGVEMSVFRVPSRHGLASTTADRALPPDDREADGDDEEAEVLMPPDIVARPGEDLDEALDRALSDGHEEEEEPERDDRRAARKHAHRQPQP